MSQPGYASMATQSTGQPIPYRTVSAPAPWGPSSIDTRHTAYGHDESRPWTRMSGGCKPGYFDVRRGHLHPSMGTCDAHYSHLVPHTLGPVPSHRINPFPFTNVDPYNPNTPLTRNPLAPTYNLVEIYHEPFRGRNNVIDSRGQAPHPAPVMGDQLTPTRVLAKFQYALPDYGHNRLYGSYSDMGF